MNEQVLLFEIERRQFALRIGVVQTVLRSVTLSPALGDAPHIEGYLNLRRQTIPIVAVRGLLGLSAKSIALTDALIVVENSGSLWGIRVDGGLTIHTLTSEDLEPQQHALTPESFHVEDRVVFLLNPDHVQQKLQESGLPPSGTKADT